MSAQQRTGPLSRLMALTATALWGGGQGEVGAYVGPVSGKTEQGGLCALRLWGTHVHGAVSKTPICPVQASRLLAGKVLAGCLSPQKLHSPFFSPNS